MADLKDLFAAQWKLQVDSFDTDPFTLTDEERARFILWNAYALADELHELTGEVGWKPWATSRHVNSDAALREAVDLLHFFMNICMAVAPRTWSPDDVADHLVAGYYAKRQVNVDRQREGYDGVSGKCPSCKRDRSEAVIEEFSDGPLGVHPEEVCPCGYVWH